jgi:hypothetical protein
VVLLPSEHAIGIVATNAGFHVAFNPPPVHMVPHDSFMDASDVGSESADRSVPPHFLGGGGAGGDGGGGGGGGGGVAPGAGGEGGEATTADPAVSAAATGHHVLKNKSAWAKPNADKQPGRAQKTHRAGATTHT